MVAVAGADLAGKPLFVSNPGISNGRNLTGEIYIVYRVVLYLNRQASHPQLKRHPLRHRPALKHTSYLQTEVIVEMTCLMSLDDKATFPLTLQFSFWLRGLPKVSPGLILLEVHV